MPLRRRRTNPSVARSVSCYVDRVEPPVAVLSSPVGRFWMHPRPSGYGLSRACVSFGHVGPEMPTPCWRPCYRKGARDRFLKRALRIDSRFRGEASSAPVIA